MDMSQTMKLIHPFQLNHNIQQNFTQLQHNNYVIIGLFIIFGYGCSIYSMFRTLHSIQCDSDCIKCNWQQFCNICYQLHSTRRSVPFLLYNVIVERMIRYESVYFTDWTLQINALLQHQDSFMTNGNKLLHWYYSMRCLDWMYVS